MRYNGPMKNNPLFPKSDSSDLMEQYEQAALMDDIDNNIYKGGDEN